MKMSDPTSTFLSVAFRVSILVALGAVAALPQTTAVARQSSEFFVATDGNDTNPGSPEQPFATMHRAQQAARAARVAMPSDGVTITVRGGKYQLNRPLEFSSVDSGASSDAPVKYRAAEGEEVVLSGGREIANWQADPNRPSVWRTRVANPEQDQDWRFEQLWVNNQRAVRARTPDYWQFHSLVKDVTEEQTAEPNRFKHTFTTQADHLEPLVKLAESELRDVQVLVFHKWSTMFAMADFTSTTEKRISSATTSLRSAKKVKLR